MLVSSSTAVHVVATRGLHGGHCPLTDREFSLVQRYISYITEEILTLGLAPQIEHDFDLFARIRSTVSDKFVYPSFDPRFSDIASGGADALWVRAVDANGETAATSAARIFETENFLRLLAEGQLWYWQPAPDDGVSVLETAA